MDFWDFFWLMVYSFFFVAYLMVLFQVIADLFRDKELSGWWKALWIIFLVFVPVLTALVYLIARGRGMAQRHGEMVTEARRDTESYIRDVAATAPAASPAVRPYCPSLHARAWAVTGLSTIGRQPRRKAVLFTQ
jgi:hypothetical protein